MVYGTMLKISECNKYGIYKTKQQGDVRIWIWLSVEGIITDHNLTELNWEDNWDYDYINKKLLRRYILHRQGQWSTNVTSFGGLKIVPCNSQTYASGIRSTVHFDDLIGAINLIKGSNTRLSSSIWIGDCGRCKKFATQLCSWKCTFGL